VAFSVFAAVLVPSQGAVGAAWSWVATVCIWNAALAYSVRRCLGFWVLPWSWLRREING
jgi:O-antigen/teichoic acid export membrane protein